MIVKQMQKTGRPRENQGLKKENKFKNDRNAGSKTSNKAIKMGQGQGAPRVSKEEQVFSEAGEDTDMQHVKESARNRYSGR